MDMKKILLALVFGIALSSLTASAASAANVVSLPALQEAAGNDPYGSQGATTLGAVDSVKIVEAALAEEGLLSDTYAYDGSYGTATINAYKKWQESLGSPAKYCDGIPGKKDLTKLGNKYGFTVDTSTVVDSYLFDSEGDTEKLDVPVAKFSATPKSGNTPLTVEFNDESTETPTNWYWTFGDGDTSTQQNPEHIYFEAGSYTVTLTATNDAGSDKKTRTEYINVKESTKDTEISASKSVSLYYLELAANSDPGRSQGEITPGATDSVKIVEAALAEEGLLSDTYAYDGSYGTATINAYKKWQESLGSPAKYCDGIPGKKDLTKLGNKYGFTVDASKASYIKVKEPTKDNKAKEVGSLKLSDKGAKFIQKQEGCPMKNGLVVMYNDQADHCTIGYGHLIHYHPIDGRASEKPYKNGITKAQALDLFRSDVAKYEAAVNSYVKVPLTQYQFDALVIFAYNVGIDQNGLLGSSALTELNKGNYNAVPSKMKLYNKVLNTETGKLVVSEGLVNRRNAEANLFIKGTY